MSSSTAGPTPRTPSSALNAILDAALNEYKETTGGGLLEHPLAAEVRRCDSIGAISDILQGQAREFEQFRDGDHRLMKWINPMVDVLSTFSETIGGVAGIAFPPAGAVFAGIGVLLSAGKDVRASHDALVELFERIESVFRRLGVYTQISLTTEMEEVFVKITAEVLSILSIATKEVKRNRTKIYFRQLLGRTDIEDAFKRLDDLIQEEVRMAIAQTLKATIELKEDSAKANWEIANYMYEIKWNQIEQGIRKWFSPPDPSTNHNAACEVYNNVPPTWFFKASVFDDWMSNGSLLWVHGKPGSGKSIFCSAIIQHIMKVRDAGNATLAYFYFDYRDEEKQNVRNVVTSLLVQLSAYSKPSCDIIYRLYLTHGRGMQQPSNGVLVDRLKEMLVVVAHRPIFVIMDALDECPNRGMPAPREAVLNLVKDLVYLQLQVPNLHICVTSRPAVDIQNKLKPLAVNTISLQDETRQKIVIYDYVSSVVSTDEQMKQWRDEDKKLVVEGLTERADGMFQWVFCQLETLRYAVQPDVLGILEMLPKTLDETYERLLKNINENNRRHAHHLLHCVAVSVRPLRVEELAEILTFDFGAAKGSIPKYRPDRRPNNQEAAILSICSNLITIADNRGSRVVQFSHLSVKEFLTSDHLASARGDLSLYHILPASAHTILAQVCLGFLLHPNDYNDEKSVQGSPLTEYAAQHWVTHAQFEDVATVVMDSMKTLFDTDNPYFSAWICLFDADAEFGGRLSSETPSPLYYSAFHGFHDLVRYLAIKHPQDVNAFGGSYEFPLFAALRRNHFKVAETLLEHGGNVDARGKREQTTLHKTIDWHDKLAIDAVLLLLKHGADVNSQRNDLWTPLHLATYNGNLAVAQILLDHGADVNLRNDDDQAPLHLLSGRETFQDEKDVSDIARLLLERGADVDEKDQVNVTPLHLVSYNKRLKTATVPLDHGANADAGKYQGETPMQIILGDTLVNGEESKYHRSQSSKPPTRVSLSTPPPTAERGRLRSFGEPGDVASKVTQPIISITRAAPTSVTEANTREIAHPPAVSLGGAAAPATSALAQSAFASRTLSRSRSTAEFSERAGAHKLDGEGAFTPAAAWWGKSNRQRTNPIEQAEGYTYTRSRVIEAVGGALGTDASFGHEALFAGVDLLQFSPVPGLITAGTVLLNIWDAIENVQTNRQASLRLTERCASILISIRHEIVDTTGYTVPEELGRPIAKIVDAFEEVRLFLDKLGKRPFLKRYLGRNETLSCIAACDSSLRDAFDMLNHSIQIRTLRLIQVNEQRKQKDSETHDLFESVSHVYPGLPPADPTSLPAALHSSPANPESVRNTLHALRASQNERDRSYNMADLHQLMRAALAANDDVAMLEVLQIARSEMPEAVKTLERLVEDGELNTEESTTALPSQHEKIGKADDFPSWEIARFEIDLEAKVGIGRFSDVYRGTWRKHTVAVKMLSETTPREAFLREVGIWKFLHLDHPNVLEVFGASSASGDPPWFLVSKYYPRGNLVKYLKGLSDADAAGVEALKMIYEISKGMAYLHKQGVLHGDLKASNILVDDDTRCVISDFGQSEMKSEVCRITGISQPRGTLRWQAPELMEGAQALTQEMDVYAFAICCWEILMMGSLPWPFLDDDSVRHSILNENMRPSIPPSNLVNDQLMNVIRASWDRSPSNRPSFEQIARELRKQLGTEHS